ncbi:uncharacterized protein LOC142536962 isoform X3 [Primulina tabacum]|uniref:uncharacterized protein LOC142536962 isoform X3 n=1 Tax=Primulina tabacum TaxID=48773 RepID=UPI003F59B43F
MGDHFVLLVDRLLTESTLEAAILSKNLLPSESTIENKKASFSINIMDTSVGSSTMKSEECRICHDEDEDSNMDTPCSCRGSLKYAHPKCVQRWCNEKGDTICEICHQQFKPEYTAPPPLFNYGGISVNFRGNWEISRGDLRAPHFMSMVSTNGSFPDPNFDEYTVHTSRSLLCCRIITVIFMVLLVLRHTLPFILYGAGEYSISLFMLFMLRTIGILLLIYIMVKAFTAIQRPRPRQGPPILPAADSEEENELPRIQPESHLINVP